MALDGDKTLKISNIGLYTADVATSKPTDYDEIPEAWANVGHTSIQDLLTFETEGGETTTLGSAQAAALRQDTSDAVRSMVMNLLQWEEATLGLYYGANSDYDEDTRVFSPAEKPQPTEKAVLITVEDGDYRYAFYAAKASIIGNGNISMADKQSLNQLPIRITPLSHQGKKPLDIVLPQA